MQGRTTAAQPVLSQRVERQSVSTTGYFAGLWTWCMAQIMRQEWMPVDAKQNVTTPSNAFEAVKHEHRVSNSLVIPREQDSDLAAVVKGSTGERYHGPRGRLLTFKKPK